MLPTGLYVAALVKRGRRGFGISTIPFSMFHRVVRAVKTMKRRRL